MEQELPEFSISYLRVAQPIGWRSVLKDINTFDRGALKNGGPDVLVMWQHQLDWIAKQLRLEHTTSYATPPRIMAFDPVREGDMYLAPCEQKPVLDDRAGTLFGVPVRVENPTP